MRLLLLWTGLAVLVVCGCSPPYTVTDELREPLAPGACRIGAITYELGPEYRDREPLPREPLLELREHLEAALAESDLFTDVRLWDNEAEYLVTGRIREFNDASGNLGFPGLTHIGFVSLTIDLTLQEIRGRVLFAGEFRQRVSSRYGINEVLYERIASDFTRAVQSQKR